jgi:hypothetical protein
MVQKDLHRLQMTFLSSQVESRGPILPETQPHIHALTEATTITKKAVVRYLVPGLDVRGMVQEDLHRLKMPFLSSQKESRGPLLSETQPYILLQRRQPSQKNKKK